MQDRIAAARRNLSNAEARGDRGQAAACRAEIVRLAAKLEPSAAPTPALQATATATRTTKEN